MPFRPYKSPHCFAYVPSHLVRTESHLIGWGIVADNFALSPLTISSFSYDSSSCLASSFRNQTCPCFPANLHQLFNSDRKEPPQILEAFGGSLCEFLTTVVGKVLLCKNVGDQLGSG
jgi:hypothetical protein